MWQRFTFGDIRNIGHYLGVLIVFSSVAYLIPFVTGLVCLEWGPALNYLMTAGICLIVGNALRFLRIEPARMTRQQAIAVTGLAWIVLAFFGSIPLFMSGHYATYLDALFDGVSGFTTTGATTIVDLDHLSYADNMFRFMMHLTGGLGLIVIAVGLGLFGRGGGATLYASEGRSEHVIPNIVETARFFGKLSAVFILGATAIIAVLCLFLGMEPLRAVLQAFWLAISGFMTGGFTPTSQSVLYYHNVILEMILMVLMVMGAVNFALHSEVWKGRVETFFRDLETRTMIIWLIVVTCVFAAALSTSTSFNDLPSMLRRGLFMVIAAFSTTGFQNITTNELVTVFTSGAFLILAFTMAVGGGAGSTAGGMKLRRVGIVAMSIVSTIKETLAPDSARVVVSYHHVGRQTLNSDTTREAMTVFMLFVITYMIGTLVGIAYGYDATRAVFESIAMTSNGGLATIVGPGMPVGLELTYIFQMWAGRLEFITLLALLAQIFVSLKPRKRVKNN